MNETVTLSDRGQITLPAGLRKQLGLKPGDPLIVERGQGGLVLRPAMLVPREIYDEGDIDRWNAEDEWKPGERESVEKKLRPEAP